MFFCRVVVFYGRYGWIDFFYFFFYIGMDSGYIFDGSWYIYGCDGRCLYRVIYCVWFILLVYWILEFFGYCLVIIFFDLFNVGG